MLIKQSDLHRIQDVDALLSSVPEGGWGIALVSIIKTLTRSKRPWVVRPTPAPGAWVADWLWQTPTAGCRAQTLMSQPHAASLGHAAVCSSLAPAARLCLITSTPISTYLSA